MTPQQEISKLISDAKILINKAEMIADAHNLSFDFSLTYGMGGTYVPKRTSYSKSELLLMIQNGTYANLPEKIKQDSIEVLSGKEYDTDWNNSNDEYSGETGWVSSSHNC